MDKLERDLRALQHELVTNPPTDPAPLTAAIARKQRLAGPAAVCPRCKTVWSRVPGVRKVRLQQQPRPTPPLALCPVLLCPDCLLT